MKKVMVNDSLEIAQPEGFRLMDKQELVHAYEIDYPLMWGMRDEERHVVLSVFWKVNNKLLAKLATPKLVADSRRNTLRRILKERDLHFDEEFTSEIAGLKARGMRYRYVNNGNQYTCEYVVVINDRTCYTIDYYSRSDHAEENRPLYEEILSSVAFVG